MKILFKPRNGSPGQKFTFRNGEVLVAGEKYTVGVSVDGVLAAGLVATGDAKKIRDFAGVRPLEAEGKGESRKRKTKRERSSKGAREFLGFSAPESVGEVADEVGGE